MSCVSKSLYYDKKYICVDTFRHFLFNFWKLLILNPCVKTYNISLIKPNGLLQWVVQIMNIYLLDQWPCTYRSQNFSGNTWISILLNWRNKNSRISEFCIFSNSRWRIVFLYPYIYIKRKRNNSINTKKQAVTNSMFLSNFKLLDFSSFQTWISVIFSFVKIHSFFCNFT